MTDPRDAHELARLNHASRDGLSLLSWRDDGGELRILQLGRQRVWIGRDPHACAAITWDPRVSGVHAELTVAGRTWFIEDADSANGTYVNGGRISSKVRLQHRDRIQVGSSVLAFRVPGATPALTPTAVGAESDGPPTFDAVDRRILVELCRRFVLEPAPVTVPNKAIAAALGYGEDAIARRLGNMYKRCGFAHLDDGEKRVALASLAVRTGAVSRQDYSSGPRGGTTH